MSQCWINLGRGEQNTCSWALAVAAGFFLAIFLPPAAAQENSRLALVIGNQGYVAKVGPLRNPHNDVNLMETSLKQLGFRVTVLKDASYKAMDSALKRYVTEVRRAGRNALSFFYYSGHGVANPETQINYLIPVDVMDAEDDKVWFESFQQTAIIDLLSKQAPNATHYVVFDACRNELNIAGTAAKALGADKGFVPIADTAGLLIAYATAPRKTASDVGNNGGPYAKILSEELMKPGIEAVTMFRNVQLRVKQTIAQDPWLSFPSLPAVYFAGAKPPDVAELTFWDAVKDSSNPTVLNTYLQRYPNGDFASTARILIEHYEWQLKSANEKTELIAHNEALQKALEEARLAREAATAAEEQRLVAMKAVSEATQAAEAAKKRTGGDEHVLAALPKPEPARPNFDGNWTFRYSSKTCPSETGNGSIQVTIRGTTMTRPDGSVSPVRVDPSGSIRGTTPSRGDGAPVDWSGRLQGNSGSGTYVRRDRGCSGVFTARRN